MNAAAIAAIALSAVMLSSIAAVPSYAQTTPLQDPISLTADKEEPYAAGETVTVTGTVARPGQSTVPITVQVLGPPDNNNRVFVNQIQLDEGGQFEFTFTVGGPQWREPGTYTVNVTYGPIPANAVSASTTIEFTGGAPAPTPPPVEPEPAGPEVDPELAGLFSSIEIEGGEIVSITKSNSPPSIFITINAEDDGTLTVPIPRSILDAKTEGQEGDDVPFSVLINDEFNNEFEEIDTTPAARTLMISFLSGDDQIIQIVGSFVIPEFGAVAVVVLAAAIVAIVAVGSRSRLGIMPRY